MKYLLFLLVFLMFSCKSYKNHVIYFYNLNDPNFSFASSENSAIFDYHSKLGYIAHNEITYPIPFSIKIPLHIQQFRCFGSDEFIFYFPYKQAIYLHLDIYTKKSIKDTIYYPNIDEIIEIKEEAFEDLGEFKKAVKRLNASRIYKMYVKNNAKILLYNIRKKDYAQFDSLIQSFTLNERKKDSTIISDYPVIK